jgi:hypothetical protein
MADGSRLDGHRATADGSNLGYQSVTASQPADRCSELGPGVGNEPGVERVAWVSARTTVHHDAALSPLHQQPRRRIPRRIHGADTQQSEANDNGIG